MKKLLGLVVVGMVGLSVIGCESTEETQPVEFSQVEETVVEETVKVEPTNLVIDGETATIEITNIKKVKDWDGNNAITIEYSFTNKQEEPTCGLVGAAFEVFQNGKSMESACVDDTEFNEQVDLMQGMTQEKCRAYYVVEDDSIVTLYGVENYGSLWVEHSQMPTFEIDLSNPESISIVRVAN